MCIRTQPLLVLVIVHGLLIPNAISASEPNYFYAPKKEIGWSISDWIKALGVAQEFEAKEYGFNRHTKEPVVLLKLKWELTECSFWLNTSGGDSILYELKSSDTGLIQQLHLPITVESLESLMSLGTPTNEAPDSRIYQVCYEAGCSRILIEASANEITEVIWQWDLN